MLIKAAAIAGGGWLVWGKWIGLGLLFMAMLWYVHDEGKQSARGHWEPLLIACQNDYKEFRTGVAHKTELSIKLTEVKDDLYLAQRAKEKLENEIKLNSIATSLLKYQRDRLRDKENLHTQRNRIFSLSALLDNLGESHRRTELAPRLEYVNQGFAKLAHRGDIAIQRTIQCKREIQLVPGLVLTD